MDKVFIKNLRVRGILGINDWERLKTRDILINAVIFTDTLPAAQSDDISDCVDYSKLAAKLRDHTENVSRMTIEALANDLAGICLREPKVVRVILRVDKPGALLEMESAGVEVERAKRD